METLPFVLISLAQIVSYKMYSSFEEVKKAIANNETSVSELVAGYLSNIKKYQHLNAFLEVFDDEVKAEAKRVDEKIKNGTAGKLAGMVIALKDVLCYKGHEVTASSKILKGFKSLYSATCVQRLLDEDAIIIGRTNCDEFAMGSSNENSAYGPVKNGLDETKVPGGSSGGSAVAVQMKMCLAALGTDTGGSIRQPASFCGVVGMKPSYGRISRYGLIAYASSFDQAGPLTNNVADAALLTEVMSGNDDFDSTASNTKVETYSTQLHFNNKISVAYFDSAVNHPALDSEIADGMKSLYHSLEQDGHQVNRADFHLLDYLVPTYYVLTTAEASSNLSRFDGIRFGHRSENATDLESTYRKNRSEGFGEEVKRRIMLGTFVLSAGYYDAYYTKAQRMRRLVRDTTNEILKQNDFIVIPTAPATAFGLGEKAMDPIALYLADLYTVQASIAGLPAISIPLGKHSNGLPYGVQVIGRNLDEKNLFAFSNYLMQNFAKH